MLSKDHARMLILVVWLAHCTRLGQGSTNYYNVQVVAGAIYSWATDNHLNPDRETLSTNDKFRILVYILVKLEGNTTSSWGSLGLVRSGTSCRRTKAAWRGVETGRNGDSRVYCALIHPLMRKLYLSGMIIMLGGTVRMLFWKGLCWKMTGCLIPVSGLKYRSIDWVVCW